MDRPLFSEMLVERRRQLGLSIKQASNVLRLKEEVLIAFEEGDFESIPKSGYAQGMLSSYARYLGLNAKTVVNQFSTDLFEHERGAGSHEARRRSRRNRDSVDGPLYETPQANVGQYQRRTYVESHGFLPTSGGFAGDMGDFATTSSPRPRYSTSTHSDSAVQAYPQGRPYTSRVPVSTSVSPLGQSQRQRPTTRSYGQQDSYATNGRHYAGSYGARDEVTTRRVMPSQYRDDMRLDNDGGSYQSASSSAGRRSSRNIASTQRPNVRRRTGAESRSQMRNRASSPAHGGILGMIEVFFQDRSRTMALIIAITCLILTAIIIFSVHSCVGSQQSTGRSVTVTSTAENTSTEQDEETMTDEEELRAREEAAAAKAAETESSPTERTIEVTVDDGEVTWLEIEYDGNSDVAETVTGPWNRTYTVRQSISINVNDTTAVTVTENGKKLEFDAKASGIGTITIQVAKKGEATSEADDATQTDDQSQTQDGTTTTQDQQSQTTDPTVTQQQDGTVSGTQQQVGGGTVSYEGYTLDADGYYYGADGYYDAAGNFYQY